MTTGNAFDEEHLDEHGECRAEIGRLNAALLSVIGYLCSAKIDLEAGLPKRKAIMTIEGGLAAARSALAKVEQPQ